MPPLAIDRHPSERVTSDQITSAQLREIASRLLRTMLKMEFEWSPNGVDAPGEESLMAAVRISGRRNATLQIYAPLELARQIARAMFGQSGHPLDEDDVFDAFGEVVNVIGGNLKGLIEQEGNLSLPCVGMAKQETSTAGMEITFRYRRAPLNLIWVQD